ncbi:MAG: FUSC family protein, partial [Gammaproteobacteria bacterium]
IVALTFIALFAQERWLFMLFLSAYVGFCTYMMGGTKHQYFWHVCGFVCAIICMSAGPNSIKAFETALLRAQETGLGILVYSLVSIFIWPITSRADFEAAAGNLLATQKQLFRSYLNLMSGLRGTGEAQALRAQEVQEMTRFGQLLDAAQTDTYEVWEVRQQWARYRSHAVELTETMARWRVSFAEVKSLDLSRLLPNLDTFGAELEERLVQIGRMLANQAPERHPAAMDLAGVWGRNRAPAAWRVCARSGSHDVRNQGHRYHVAGISRRDLY